MKPIFLIVDPDVFVADDLSEVIRETVEGAQIIHAPEVDEHTIQIVEEMSVYGVFLGGFAEDESSRDLGTRLSERGVALARIGRTGDRRFTSGEPEQHIVSPFTSEGVADVLRAWTATRPLPTPFVIRNGDRRIN